MLQNSFCNVLFFFYLILHKHPNTHLIASHVFFSRSVCLLISPAREESGSEGIQSEKRD
jgi:hypothetical protein